MRITFLLAALAVALVGPGPSIAGDPLAAPKTLQFNIRVYEGDPLGTPESGTLKVLADTRLVTLENRPASLVMGGELPLARDGKNIEYVQFGRTLECKPVMARDGKVHVDVNFSNTTVAANTTERIDLHAESARTLTTMKPGESLKLRWPGGTPEKQAWAELTVNVIDEIPR
jgi:hypothetical protein